MAAYQLHPLVSDFVNRLDSLCTANQKDTALELVKELTKTLRAVIEDWDYGKMNNIPELQVWKCEGTPTPLIPLKESNVLVRAVALVLAELDVEEAEEAAESKNPSSGSEKTSLGEGRTNLATTASTPEVYCVSNPISPPATKENDL